MMRMLFRYGMRLRGFSLGCQPTKGLMDWKDTGGKYWSVLTYDRPLTQKECDTYDLDYIDEEVCDV